jgi:hypothetical protein
MTIHRSEKTQRALKELKHMADSPYFLFLTCIVVSLVFLGVHTVHEAVAFAARRN